MKKTDYSKMTDQDLVNREMEIFSELAAARLKRATGQFKKTSEFPRLRKEIARVKTILQQRKIAGSGGVA